MCRNQNRHRRSAVQRQIEAMGAVAPEVGLFKPDARDGEAIMLPRVWDRDVLLRSVPWLRYQNRDGRTDMSGPWSR